MPGSRSDLHLTVSTPRTKRVYNTRRWQYTRMAVLARDHHCCQLNLPGCTLTATEGDHIISLESDITLAFTLSNVQAACRHCNVTKRNDEGETRGWLR